jgi:hypothetical protein
MEDMQRKAHVWEALDNSKANGYTNENMTPLQIAEELVDKDSDLEYETPESLVTHVISWYAREADRGERFRPDALDYD